MSGASIETVTVALTGGRSLKLIADINALCEFESVMQRSGFDAATALASLEANATPTLSALRAMIYGMTRAHHPDLSLTAVGAILMADPEALRDGMTRALEAAAPPEADDTGDAPGKTSPSNP